MQTYSYRITTKSFQNSLSEKIDAFKMPDDKTSTNKKTFSPDWLVRGVLTKIGDIFDKLTGRSWKPSSSLATSELVDRLKLLLDQEAKNTGAKGIFVPHNIKLKMQWDKFSIDSEDALKKLENELLIAAIDHINDHRYHTYAPLKLEVKPDYFTQGVKLLVGFDNFAETDEEAAVNVSVPDLKNIVIASLPEVKIEPEKELYIFEFTVKDKPKRVELEFVRGERFSVGRTKENALAIEDGSVSKIHASLVLNAENQLMVADTGSTNGTFINDKRISYGKAFPVAEGDKVKFGLIDVSLKHVPREVESPQEIEPPQETEQTQQAYRQQKTEQLSAPVTSVFPMPEDLTTRAKNRVVQEEIPDKKTFVQEETSDKKTFVNEESLVTKKDPVSNNLTQEENVQSTEPGIKLDFGENK